MSGTAGYILTGIMQLSAFPSLPGGPNPLIWLGGLDASPCQNVGDASPHPQTVDAPVFVQKC